MTQWPPVHCVSFSTRWSDMGQMEKLWLRSTLVSHIWTYFHTQSALTKLQVVVKLTLMCEGCPAVGLNVSLFFLSQNAFHVFGNSSSRWHNLLGVPVLRYRSRSLNPSLLYTDWQHIYSTSHFLPPASNNVIFGCEPSLHMAAGCYIHTHTRLLN